MVKININNYEWKKGLMKTLKNSLVFLAPSILVWLAGVPTEYSAIAGIIAYYIKNYVENSK